MHTYESLDLLRNDCRLLAYSNEFAINALENRINYAVGQGHRYQAVAKNPHDDDTAQRAQDILDTFCDENDWPRRQREIMRRRDRDGEVFCRLFPSRNSILQVRFVEPEQIATPPKYFNKPHMSFGIQSDPDDIETALGYWIDGTWVNADSIQHRKANVDSNVKRGLPLLVPVRKNLRRAEKLLRNMSVVAEIQSAIALIRKHQTTEREAVRQFVQNQATKQVVDSETGQVQTFRHFSPGTIIDSGANMEYEFPASAIDASKYILVLQAELRAIASRLVMPEFMLTSDTSNASYTSTMVSEGPAVRMFERLQYEIIGEDKQLFKMLFREAENQGLLPSGALHRISIHAIAPMLAARDRLNEARADEILYGLGVISKETLAMRYGLDPSQEERLCACDP
ncbi:MAG: phage portal protein [Planctomycetaceae bacterium]|nr:phage portal protein [Planctomycetaceae bacterium]